MPRSSVAGAVAQIIAPLDPRYTALGLQKPATAKFHSANYRTFRLNEGATDE
jgi:hypothetical protein